jgi:Zn ribbon nucleic-acid-binding protein
VIIPIWVFWTKYTATTRGSVLKVVSCENCSIEYVYLMEREGAGVGTSVYMLNNQGAADHAKSAAADTLQSVLENDFDAVPCPACGHYQRYMFQKLPETKGWWVQVALLVVIMIGCLDAVIALYWSAEYLQGPNDYSFGNMVTAWSVLPLLGLIGLGLSVLKRFKSRRFDPNLEDQQARIAIGRSRAVTRAEFEKTQQGDGRTTIRSNRSS